MKQYLTASDLSKYYADQLVFEGASFSIHEAQKIILVGPNGTGKSTLLKLIAGIEVPDSGIINMTNGTTFGYADQHVHFNEDETIYEIMLAIIADKLLLLDEIKAVEALFATTDYDSEAFEKLSNRYDALQQTAQQSGIYQLETKIKMLLTRFGFDAPSWETSVLSLSGGQQIRLHLAKLLLSEPDILLLDEPTNHLDIETIIWLDAYLKNYPKAIVLISHDEKLLNSLATKVWQIISGELFSFNGTYANYKNHLKNHLDFLKKQQESLLDQKQKLSEFIAKNKARSSTAGRAQSAVKKLDKMDDIKQLRVAITLKEFSLPILRPSGKFIFKLHELVVGYTEGLYEPLNFDVLRYERIALVGQNGIGKSTLLRVLAGLNEPLAGSLDKGHHVDIAFFQQQQVFAKNSVSVYDTFADVYPDANREIIYPILARFGFPQEDVHMNNTTLSGGEKQRLLLSLLYYQKANTLLLDEPTNHLDLQSKHALIASLLKFDGTLLFASHDRDFIEQTATKIVFFHSGKHYVFDTYADFETFSTGEPQQATSLVIATDAQQQRIDGKKRDAEIRKIQKNIDTIEVDAERIEQEILLLKERLLDVAVYSDFQRAQGVAMDIEKGTLAIAQTMEKWEQYQLMLEELEKS